MKKNYIFILSTILIAVVIIISLITLATKNINNKPPQNLVSSPISYFSIVSYATVSSPISYPYKLNQYNAEDGPYTFSYPSNWEFINNRTGHGLVPREVCEKSLCTEELLTIFSVQSNETARNWAESYDGGGAFTGQNILVNGYQAYKAIYKMDSFTDVKYTIAYKGLIIHTNFREFDNTRGENIDNSKYLDDVERIVNSIIIH